MQTRFAHIKPSAALLMLLTLLLAIAAGGSIWRAENLKPAKPKVVPTFGDMHLYFAVIDRVHAGDNYHVAAVDEQRKHDYPTRPFMVVRPPALALFLAQLPSPSSRILAFRILLLVTFFAWVRRFRHLFPNPLTRLLAMIFFMLELVNIFFADNAYSFHECWAALLVGLSLVLRTEERWHAAVVIGMMAAVVRELAMPYLWVMAFVAWREKQHQEMFGWLAAFVISAVLLFWHAEATLAVTHGLGKASLSWVRFGGWLAAMQFHGWSSGPNQIGLEAIWLPLSITGALGWPGKQGERLALLVLGYTAGFTVLGRAPNVYWGLIPAIPMMLGALMIIPSLSDLWHSARGFRFRAPS